MKIANILVSDSWGEVSPSAFNRGIGGREGAMIFLSREWAKLGHEVTNFVNIEKSARIDEDSGFHEYVPLNITRPILENFPYDVAIAWECPSVFDANDVQAKLKMTEMQVCHLGAVEAKAAAEHCDYVAALSNWHRGFLLDSQLDMPKEKVVVFPNGVDIKRYRSFDILKKIKDGSVSDSPQFVYSSSPDRALWQLLQAWPFIRESFPGATLKVGYGVKNWTTHLKWSHSRQGEQALQIEELLELPGVEDIGKVGQDHLSKLQIRSDAWLYPLDSIQATESGCITAIENAAAGNPIITTNCDCMEEEFGPVGVIAELPFDPEGFAECVEFVLTDANLVADLRKDGREFAESRDWAKIAPQWIDFFEERI